MFVTVLLAALAWLGASALHSATLAERIAGAVADRELALAAAEAALRDARLDAEGVRTDGSPCIAGSGGCRAAGERPLDTREGAPPLPGDADCTGGQCTFAGAGVAAPAHRFLADNCDSDTAIALGTYTGALPLPGVAEQPCYLLEFAAVPSPDGKTRPLVRITVRATGAQASTVVFVQQTQLGSNP